MKENLGEKHFISETIFRDSKDFLKFLGILKKLWVHENDLVVKILRCEFLRG